MTIVVTGSTGTIGSKLVAQLASAGAHVRALARSPGKCHFPDAVEVVEGDLSDVPSVQRALSGARTLFLLNAVSPDELNQALVALNLAQSEGIRRIVYLSVTRAHAFSNVPHFAAKAAAERMIVEFDMPATVLRPNYFMQNDVDMEMSIRQHGIYPMPIGSKGLSMIDVRDIVDVAALEILRRDRAPEPLPRDVIELGGPDLVDGDWAASLWSQYLGHTVAYGGDDFAAWRRAVGTGIASWFDFDMYQMMGRFQHEGLAASTHDKQRLAKLLGRPLRSYETFVAETARTWLASPPPEAVRADE